MTDTKLKEHITSKHFGIPADLADLAENYAQWSVQALSEQLAEAQALKDAQVAQQAEQGWQPISTAPKDGTEILMTNGLHVSSGQWFAEDHGTYDLDGAPNGDEREAGWMDWSGGMQPDPNYWMPLPTPPKGGVL